MASDRRKAGKCVGDDLDAEMAAAAARTGMTGVQMAFVVDQQMLWLEGGLQPLPDHLDAIAAAHAGSALMNGLTVTRA